ncbi:tolloid-like protein 1 [Penaeus vannamei]|uniref:tolloid-like protein 1 n=1 Tax=Penaeus vannamei TaxID=6689 RepID=UPI00387F8512
MRVHCFQLFLLLGGSWQLCGASDYLSRKAESENEADFYEDEVDSRELDDYDDYDLEEGEPDYFDDDDEGEEPFARFRRAVRYQLRDRVSKRHDRFRAHACKNRGGKCYGNPEDCDGRVISKFCSKMKGICCIPPWNFPEFNCTGRQIYMTDGEVIEDSEGIIISGYPDIYDRNSYHKVILNAPEDHVVEIEFKGLDLEYDSFCNHDYLRVVDTYTNQGLGWFNEPRVCGDVLPPIMRSTSHSVTLEMVTDYNIQKGGFVACFKMVPSP